MLLSSYFSQNKKILSNTVIFFMNYLSKYKDLCKLDHIRPGTSWFDWLCQNYYCIYLCVFSRVVVLTTPSSLSISWIRLLFSKSLIRFERSCCGRFDFDWLIIKRMSSLFLKIRFKKILKCCCYKALRITFFLRIWLKY